MKKAVFATLLLLVLSGCNQSMRRLSAASDLNIVPGSFENQGGNQNTGRDLPIKKTKSEKPIKPEASSIAVNSKIIYYAQKVIETEGRKLGTPCNFYLRRVLEVSGFPSKGFVANDFDIYAEKFFSFSKSQNFVNDVKGTDHVNLKNHLWSYPEGTPFILQWTGTNSGGHLGILERRRDILTIYHASLHKFTARKETTTVDILLHGFNGRTLTVYSEFE